MLWVITSWLNLSLSVKLKNRLFVFTLMCTLDSIATVYLYNMSLNCNDGLCLDSFSVYSGGQRKLQACRETWN